MFIDAAGTECLKLWAGIGATTTVTRGVTATVSLYYFSIAVSMFLVGGMIGALSGGWVAEKFGRKLNFYTIFTCKPYE